MTGNSSNDPAQPGPTRSNDADWEALSRYYAGESTDAEASAVRAWLAAHPSEAARFEAIEAGIQRISADLNADIDVEAALKRVAVRRDEAAQSKPRLVPAATTERSARKPLPATRSTTRSWRIPAIAAAASFRRATLRTFVAVKVPSLNGRRPVNRTSPGLAGN